MLNPCSKKTNNLNFYDLNKYFTCIFVYKILTNRFPMFSNIFDNDFFHYACSNRKQYYIQSNKSKTNILYKHIYCCGPRQWNNLLNAGFEYKFVTLKLFKKLVKHLLINENYN